MTNAPNAYEVNGAPAAAEQFNQMALNPNQSIVVRACAGSGKTWLLTSRIIRLLLDGVPPQHILAITFTKKAAQEMRDRVALVLQSLADDSDEVVLSALTERGLSNDEAKAALPRARLLYNEALGSGVEVPIYTFHAWFYRLLQAAPMGAGVMRDASLIEDASELRELAWDDFYALMNTAVDELFPLREAYLSLIRELGESSTIKILDKALSQATEILLFKNECRKNNLSVIEALAQDMLEQTGLSIDAGEAGVYQRWADGLNAHHELDKLIDVLSVGDEKKQARAQTLGQVIDIDDARAKFAAFEPFLVKSQTNLNGVIFKMTAKQVTDMAGRISKDDYDDALTLLNYGFTRIQQGLADLRAFELHVHALPCVDALIEAYQTIKRRTRQLDFNDIEHQCFELLRHPHTAAYVQVQLDARYKHLLFDEFQDTNPLQWQIISSWLDGYEHDAAKPCVFVVGDVKQSIYRFRKADARLFDAAEQLLVEKYHAAVLKTHATRRNSAAVVSWVNALFELEACQLADFTAHTTFNKDIGHVACLGLTEIVETEVVEIESVENTSEATTRDWLTVPQETIKIDARDDESAQIIQAIHQLVDHYPVKDEHTGMYRPAEYRDIMLLVYTRTHLMGYERLLREAQIPFTSSRRGGLLDTLEALDIMAVVQWLMDVDDDLALLHVLRTPIFNVSHDDFAILLDVVMAQTEATVEKERTTVVKPSYWSVLKAHESLSESLCHARNLLSDWLKIAPHMPPHDVLDRIYAQGEVLKNYAKLTPIWLNAQVQANLREFLQLALKVNSGRYPSLSGYWQALKRWQALESEGPPEAEPLGMNNAVRILTTHASKGLEAPIVMLIDMKTGREKVENNLWFVDWPIGATTPSHVSWVSTKARVGDWRGEQLNEQLERARIEKLNQCYVAMTRARQLLVVSAAQEVSNESDDDEPTESFRSTAKKTGLYEHLQSVQNQLDTTAKLAQDPEKWSIHFDDWALKTVDYQSEQAPTAEKAKYNTYVDVPLNAEGNEYFATQTAAIELKLNNATDNNYAADIGTAWHGALQFATDNAGQTLNTAEIVQRFGISVAQANRVQDWTKSTLQNTDWQIWFDSTQYDEAFNEIAIMTANGSVKRIDRFVRRGGAVDVLDYKSDWDAANIEEYKAQLREYMVLIGELYAGLEVNGFLISPTGKSHHQIL